jgi:hypothetical protein
MEVRLLTAAELAQMRQCGTFHAKAASPDSRAELHFYKKHTRFSVSTFGLAVHNDHYFLPYMILPTIVRRLAGNCVVVTLTVCPRDTQDDTVSSSRALALRTALVARNNTHVRTLVAAVCCPRLSAQVLHDCIYRDFLV